MPTPDKQLQDLITRGKETTIRGLRVVLSPDPYNTAHVVYLPNGTMYFCHAWTLSGLYRFVSKYCK